jgi:uncharacterized phage protein gp47/JayE
VLTVEQITQNILQQLKLLDPSASAEVGTPERKIIESVAETVARFQVDFAVLNQQHDITSMTGGRLDAYLGNYGFARQQGTAATGRVTFYRETPADSPVTIQRGTQVIATIDDSAFPDILFTTTETVVIATGESEIGANAQCSIPGTIGNVDANTIQGFAGFRNVAGVSGVRNDDGTFGGVDGEDDTAYKIRFKNTLFRNMAGTYDQFLALALSAPAVTKVNVLGPISRFQEYIQVPFVTITNNLPPPGFPGPVLVPDVAQRTRIVTGFSGSTPQYAYGGYDNHVGNIGDPYNWAYKTTSAYSSIPYSKYTYLEQFYLADRNLDAAAAKFFRHGVDYVFNSPPVVPGSNPQEFDFTDEDSKYIIRNGTLVQLATSGTGVHNTNKISGLSSTADLVVGMRVQADDVLTYLGFQIDSSGTWGINVEGGLDANIVSKTSTTVTLDKNAYIPGSTLATTFTFSHPQNHAKTQPNITILGKKVTNNPADAANWPEGLNPGDLAVLEHAYISKSSRNSYDLGILNAIDIFVNGSSPTTASSIEVVPTASNLLQDANTSVWNYQLTTVGPANVINFRRTLDGRASLKGNMVQPLFWQPVLTVPDSLTVGGETYFRANYFNTADGRYYNRRSGSGTTASPYVYSYLAHYCQVDEVNGHYGSLRARNGIEWFIVNNDLISGHTNYLGAKKATDHPDTSPTGGYSGKKINNAAIAGKQFTAVNYIYDSNVSDLQAIMDKHKQVTTDVLVHRAKPRYFKPYVAVMYTPGISKDVVDASIAESLSVYFNNQYFGAAIQMSDILQTIHNVPGVDNVRWQSDQDTSKHKVEEVNLDGTSLQTGTKYIDSDFFIQDSELSQAPTTNSVNIVRRAAGTWGK